ncbi:outer membrane protein assembly factor BamB [Candidatus Venteria ishoeyi]|uniref:outer membrane protein assembly factor BamB n=1 Tax=Candidatus Venteria ishoeyi TaxID=1899563 RepID=UPI0025A4EFDD|nr:outer membrane protein assembly factor BamB [Candidatus Venteria ishoeyi]MDM8546436.1 outer membrane protein assembly factor BamB [Candidatus Venteria ishoeyi]
MNILVRLIFSGFVLTLAACGAKDNAKPPAKLVEFSQSLGVNALWTRNTSVNLKGSSLNLSPRLSESQLITASPKGKIQAQSLQTGQNIWKHNLKQPISGGPGVGHGLVVVATSEGEVFARELSDGAERWHSSVSSEVLSTPAVAENIVIVRSIDGRVTGLSTQTGKRLWVYERNVPALSLRGAGDPLLDGHTVYIGFANGRLSALDISTGKPLWETRLAQPRGRSELERMVDVDGELTLYAGTLYASAYQGRTVAIDPLSGEILWDKESSAYAGLSADDNAVYFSDERSHVYALERYTGSSLWKQDKLDARKITAPVSIGDTIVVGDFEGYLHWLRKEDGQFVARMLTDKSGIRIRPLVVDDKLLILTNNGELHFVQGGAPSSDAEAATASEATE